MHDNRQHQVRASDRLLFIQPLVHKSRDYPQLRELGSEVFDSFGAGDEVKEQNPLLWNTATLEDFYCHNCGAA